IGWCSCWRRRRQLEALPQAACPQLDLRADAEAIAHPPGERDADRRMSAAIVPPHDDAAVAVDCGEVFATVIVEVGGNERTCRGERARDRAPRERACGDVGPAV